VSPLQGSDLLVSPTQGVAAASGLRLCPGLYCNAPLGLRTTPRPGGAPPLEEERPAKRPGVVVEADRSPPPRRDPIPASSTLVPSSRRTGCPRRYVARLLFAALKGRLDYNCPPLLQAGASAICPPRGHVTRLLFVALKGRQDYNCPPLLQAGASATCPPRGHVTRLLFVALKGRQDYSPGQSRKLRTAASGDALGNGSHHTREAL